MTIDLTSSFWQQALDKKSRPMTSFTVPGKGTRYQWTVTPMGLQGSPASFARLIDYVFRGISGVITYFDDVLTHSNGHEKQLKLLEETLLRLRKNNLKLTRQNQSSEQRPCTTWGTTFLAREFDPGKKR